MSQTTKRDGYQAAISIKSPVFLENQPNNSIYVFEGDSMTEGGAQGVVSWVDYIKNMEWVKSTNSSVFNVGTGGAKIDDLEAGYLTQVYPLRPSANNGRPATLTVWIGHNDYINLSQAAGLSDVPAWFTRLSNYWAQAKADGFKVVAITAMRRNDAYVTDVDLFDSVRREINRLILSSIVPDAKIDAASIFQDPEDSTYFLNDKTHLNQTANIIFSRVVGQVIAGYVLEPMISQLSRIYAFDNSTFRKMLNVLGVLIVADGTTKGINFGTAAKLRHDEYVNELQATTADIGAFYDFRAKNINATNLIKVPHGDSFGIYFGTNCVLRSSEYTATIEACTGDRTAFYDFRAAKVLAKNGIGVGNAVAATTPGAIVKKMQVFDENGNAIGFVPVYSSIS
jgi:hypothetical protein